MSGLLCDCVCRHVHMWQTAIITSSTCCVRAAGKMGDEGKKTDAIEEQSPLTKSKGRFFFFFFFVCLVCCVIVFVAMCTCGNFFVFANWYNC